VVGALLVTWMSLDSSIYHKGITTFGILPGPLQHIAIGIVALIANAIVMVVVSALTPGSRPAPEEDASDAVAAVAVRP